MGICGSNLKVRQDPIFKVSSKTAQKSGAVVPLEPANSSAFNRLGSKGSKDFKKVGSPSNILKNRSKRSSSSRKKSSTIIANTDDLYGRSSSVREDERVTAGLIFKKGHVIYKGSQGEVYQCLDVNTGQLYALKTIRKHKKRELLESEVLAFQREIMEYQKLSHPNIVKYIATELDEDGQGINIIFEFVSGGSVTQMLNKFGKFNEKLVARFTYQVLQGLNYLHEHNILHRDIKGGNILIDTDGTLKLTDFGTLKSHQKDACEINNSEECERSQELKQDKQLDSSLSQTSSQRLGYQNNMKPFWTAPEVLEKEELNERHSDVWSLGCLVIEMLTAQPPYFQLCDLSYEEIANHIKQGNLPPFPDHLSVECKEFLESTIQFIPQNRSTVDKLLQMPFIAGRDSVEAGTESISPNQQRSQVFQSQTSLGVYGGLGLGESQYQNQITTPSQAELFVDSSSKVDKKSNSNRIEIRMVQKQEKNQKVKNLKEESARILGRKRRREQNKFDSEIGKLFKESRSSAKNEYQQQLITQFKELEGETNTLNNQQMSSRSLSFQQSQVQLPTQMSKVEYRDEQENDEDESKQAQRDVEEEILMMIQMKKKNKGKVNQTIGVQQDIQKVEFQHPTNEQATENNQKINNEQKEYPKDQREIQVVFDNPKDLFTLLPPSQTIILNQNMLQNQYNDTQIKEEEDDDLSREEDDDEEKSNNGMYISKQIISEQEEQVDEEEQKSIENQENQIEQLEVNDIRDAKEDQNFQNHNNSRIEEDKKIMNFTYESYNNEKKNNMTNDIRQCDSLFEQQKSFPVQSLQMIMMTDPMTVVGGQIVMNIRQLQQGKPRKNLSRGQSFVVLDMLDKI